MNTYRSLIFVTVLVGGCAQVEVSRVASDPRAPVFELRGGVPAKLHAEAARRCPGGYEVLRESQQRQRLEHDSFMVSRWWDKARGYWDDENNRAQLTVSCKPS